MGRGKIEIKKIENVNSRQVTFSKRRQGLFKKASELAILCDAEVSVIIFSNTGKLFDFASSSMKKILSRYKKCVDGTKCPLEEPELENQQPKEADVLKDEIEKLKLKQQQLLGKDITDMGLQELNELEQQLTEGLICVKQRKEQIIMQQLYESRLQEQRVARVNETLRQQVEEFRAFLPSTSCANPPLCIEYNSRAKNSAPAIKEDSGSPETAGNGLADEHSDTTLQLGLSFGSSRKRKASDGETHSSTSDPKFRL